MAAKTFTLICYSVCVSLAMEKTVATKAKTNGRQLVELKREEGSNSIETNSLVRDAAVPSCVCISFGALL